VTVVRIPPTLRAETNGERQVEASGATLGAVLDDLTARFPGLGSQIYEDGDLAPFVNAYVEGEDVRTREGLDTPVTEGSQIILLPAMAGG
jgi:molybdopterin converting factor small subunit